MRPIASCALWLAACGLVPCAFAQEDSSGKTIGAVDIRGLERASEQIIRAQLEVKPGLVFNPRAISRDIRRLYEMGFFENIVVREETRDGGLVLLYDFTEKRFIEEVAIIGNDKIKSRDIRGVLTWKEGDSFAPEAYELERDAILNLFRSKGFLNSTVDIRVEEAAGARVRVTYAINEGRKARIGGVAFNGNAAVSDRTLRKLVKTKRAWWRFGGKYDEQKFETDLENILLEYGNHGRLEADIPATKFQYDAKGKTVDIEIDIVEGPEYKVNTLDIAGNDVFDDDELLQSAQVAGGDVHNAGQIEKDAGAIRREYESSGYIDARVDRQVTLDKENKTTNVVHAVDEGDLKYIREVVITGNEATKDEVLRRKILLGPGDRHDGALLDASRNRLAATEYFETPPRLTLEPVGDSDRWTNLLVDLDEGRMGNFNFGGGFNSEEGFDGFTELQLNNFDIANWPNFTGGGQQFSTRFSVGQTRTNYNISFTDPEFLDYPFGFGVDVFNERVRTTGGSDYTQQTAGGQLRLSKALSPYVNLQTSLLYTDVDIENFGIDFWLRRDARELQDPGATISNVWTLSRNTVDSNRDPSRGINQTLTLQVAGFGGDNEFVKAEYEWKRYWALDDEKKWILSYRTRWGAADTYGDRELVPLTDRFFAGGTTTVRGFQNRDIGPQVRSVWFLGDEQSIGGEARMLNNIEIKYKATDIVRLYGFVDSGGVWKTIDDFDMGEMKYSVGLGIGFDVPRLGPLRFDYGVPLNANDDQGSGRFHFTSGFRFF